MTKGRGGFVADDNRVETAILDGQMWSASMPLDHARSPDRGRSARSIGIGTPENPVRIPVSFPEEEVLCYAGLHDTNFDDLLTYRLRVYGEPELAGPLLWDSRSVSGLDDWALPSVYTPSELEWPDERIFSASLRKRERRLYPVNIHVPLPRLAAGSLLWELVGDGLLPDGSGPAGYLEVGLAWASDGVELHYDWGQTTDWNPGGEVKRTTGGGVWVTPGTGRRSAAVPRSGLDEATADRLFDVAVRADSNKPVVWLPEIGNAMRCFRYGFVGRLMGKTSVARRYVNGIDTALALEEWT